MTISRRSLLATSALAAAVPVLLTEAGPASAAQRKVAARSVAHRRFVLHAEAQGARQVPAEPLINDVAVTKGLNYTIDLAPDHLVPGRYVIQPCSRVSDIPERGRTGVLPYFTIGGILQDVDELAKPRAALISALQYLLGLGIPLRSLEFTTSELSVEMIEVVRALGIDPASLIVRTKDEAMAAADGSGWFVDPVTGFGTRTMSIACNRDGQKVELVEAADIGFVVGLERAEWARTGSIASWRAALPRLLADIRREAAKTGVPLPAGHALFAATAK